MFLKDNTEKIFNYGRLSYENGYRDGYMLGLVVSCFIVIASICIIKILHK